MRAAALWHRRRSDREDVVIDSHGDLLATNTFEIEQPAIPAWLDEKMVEERVGAHMKQQGFRMKPEEKTQFQMVIRRLLPAFFND